MLLLRTGEQAWFLSSTQGNHEFQKVRFESRNGAAPSYNVREGFARVGGNVDLVHLAVEADGAHLSWSTGAKSFIPKDYFQLTWLP
jgi:hypothetical protein